MTIAIPVLRRTAHVRTKSDDKAVIEWLDKEVTLEGRSASLFGKMVPHLDGKHDVSEIAGRVGESAGKVLAFAEQLAATGVVVFAEGADRSAAMSGEAFHALHHAYCAHWLRPIYAHGLWDKMATGKATRAQVLGFAFEKYHYIEGAHEHMAVAAANATPEMMPHLARHFIEEYSHGDIYRKGLRSLFRDEVILASRPLPSTRALVNFLSESAAQSSFGYYAGNELLQMTENTSDGSESRSIDDFYASLLKHYPYAAKLVDSFVAHTNADQKLGHQDVFLEMCRSVPPLTHAEVCHALNVARSMSEHLVLFLDGIDRFYARFPEIPRTSGELASFL